MTVHPFIEAEQQAGHNVKRACELLKVSRAAFYARRTATPGSRAVRDAELTEKITEVHATSRGTCGAPRVHAVLQGDADRCGRRRVARLMRRAGPRGPAPKTAPAHHDPKARSRSRSAALREHRVREGWRWGGEDIGQDGLWEGFGPGRAASRQAGVSALVGLSGLPGGFQLAELSCCVGFLMAHALDLLGGGAGLGGLDEGVAQQLGDVCVLVDGRSGPAAVDEQADIDFAVHVGAGEVAGSVVLAGDLPAPRRW
ncbi:IS3 family transposase [Kitasatospora sp. NPDC093102]|uniref:IS3 family transposase n=1 Tax=Kitasatospora sp. NPDC093102 TaxID=3155069 RepID=UPI00341BBD33